MSECPFCGAAVPDDLIMYGGPCPKCFAEIPGEEAPTDPGAEARAIQERKDRRGATIKAFIGLAAMAAVVSCTGVAALAVVLWPEPEVAVLDFDSADFDYPEFELVGSDPEEEGDAVADAGDVKPSPRPRDPGGAPDVDRYTGGGAGSVNNDGAASAKDGLSEDAVAEAGGGPRGARGGTDAAAGPAEIGGIKGPETKTGGLGLDLGPDVQRRGEVLTDPDAIRLMIGKMMARQIPMLKRCYESQLKRDESLSGRWLIRYTVSKNGRAVGASATARDTPHPELEQCLADTVEGRWKFDRINRDQPVQKTLTFRPG